MEKEIRQPVFSFLNIDLEHLRQNYETINENFN